MRGLLLLMALALGLADAQTGETPAPSTAVPQPLRRWDWPLPPTNFDTPTPTPTPMTTTAAPLADPVATGGSLPTDDTPEVTTATPNASGNTTATPEPTMVTPEPTATPESTTPASTAYTPPPIPTATADSATFRLVESTMCPDAVTKTIYALYSKNRNLFDTCAQDSDYQIFPYSGTRPTPTQIKTLAASKGCIVLFTACVNANLPECETSGVSIKAVTETLLKVTMDVESGKVSPDTDRFHRMHTWRRDSNNAKAAGVPYGNDSAIYAEYARDVPAALAKYSVDIKDDLSIVYTAAASGSGVGASYSFDAAGSQRDVSGGVHANDGATSDGSLAVATATAASRVGSDGLMM